MTRLTKTLLLACLMLCGLSMSAQEYSLTALDITADKGTNAELSICMTNNDTPITSLQCDVYLPEGVNLIFDEEEEEFVYEFNTSRTSGASMVFTCESHDNEGFVRFLIYSSKNKVFKGSEGVIFTCPIEVNAAPGIYNVTIKNIEMAEKLGDDDFSAIHPDDSTFTLNVIGSDVAATGIELNYSSLNMVIGDSMALEATVSPDNATDKTVLWSSSNESIAAVDAEGNVIAVSPGTATITATCGDVKATCVVTVNPVVATEVTLSDNILEMFIGDSRTLTATVYPENTTDKTVAWSSSNEAVATVDPNGLVKAVEAGEAVITAACGDVKATCKVNVSPITVAKITLSETSVDMLIGDTRTLTATLEPENATNKNVEWTSSNNDVATVNNGVITAVAVGNAIIYASCGDVTATCEVTVNPILGTNVTLSETALDMRIGDTRTLVATVKPESATDKTVVWTSSDPTIASVDANGVVTALAVGHAEIKAACGNAYATCDVTVNPIYASEVALNKSSLDLLIGETFTLEATVAPENTTDKTVVWTSSNDEVATVDANGVVTALAVGEAVITATCGNAYANCDVTVSPILATEVIINETSLDLLIGDVFTLGATVAPENTTDKTIVWTSSDPTIASVDANGTVKALAIGNATITATCGDVYATCEVTVNPILATDVILNKAQITLYVGYSETLEATVEPANTTDQTIVWTSADPTIASVDANGKVTAHELGNTTIIATCGLVFATCKVEVNRETGIGMVEASDVCRYYNVNGVEVSGDNLKPGIYVRIVNGQAQKVVVK